jgi:MarR family transcriptional regulator, organic hydroperoxide resistance regulator
MEELHYLLMKTHTVLNRKISIEAAKLGLSSGQPKILDYLYKYGECNQKKIASYCEIEQSTVGSILLRMETAGLIKRCQHYGNRRSLYVSLTKKGMEMAVAMNKVFEQEDTRALKSLSEEEQIQLKSLLNKVCNSIQEDDFSKETENE